MRLAGALCAIAMVCSFAAGAEARTWRVEAQSGEEALQSALSQAEPGDTIRLDRGRFVLSRPLSLGAPGVTLRGDGADRTILSFAAAAGRQAGLTVSGRDITLRDFSIEDARGPGLEARDCHTLRLSNVTAAWTAPAHGDAAGLAIINCENVLIEAARAFGAPGAGLLLSQTRTAIVRDVLAERNGAGLEIVNGARIDIFASSFHRNGVGVLLASAPGAQGGAIRVFENRILANDAASAPADALAPGTGLVIAGARDVHVFDNEIGEHGSANIIISAAAAAAPDFDPLPSNILIRNNRFGGAGFAPAAPLNQLSGVVMPDVLWDGATMYSARGLPRTAMVRIVMRNNRSSRGGIGSFLSLGLNVAGAPIGEAAPDPAFPPLLDLPEPDEVRLTD